MSNFKMLTTFTITALFAAPAFAQGAPEAVSAPVPEDVVASTFTSADLDQDESLTADEFVTFAVMRGHDGDEDYKILVLSGEYDAGFDVRDADASGGLDMSELQAGSEPADEDVAPEAPVTETDLQIDPEITFEIDPEIDPEIGIIVEEVDEPAEPDLN